MKETGLMFKAPLVRAILSDQKTQTRRLVRGVKHFPDWGSAVGVVGGAWRYGSPAALGLAERGDHWSVTLDENHLKRMCTREAYGWGAGAGCPMGQPGDRIYVRETFGHGGDAYTPDIYYRASQPDAPIQGCWHPAIHMRKADARIWLEITGVRVERLQDISEEDADAEGCERLEAERYERDWALCPKCGGTRLHDALGGNGGVIHDVDCWECDTYVKRFRYLWESTGGDWAANPWVWVIDFKRIEKP